MCIRDREQAGKEEGDEDTGPPHVMPLYMAPQTPLEVATAETFVNTCPCAHSGSPGGEARPPEVNGVPSATEKRHFASTNKRLVGQLEVEGSEDKTDQQRHDEAQGQVCVQRGVRSCGGKLAPAHRFETLLSY